MLYRHQGTPHGQSTITVDMITGVITQYDRGSNDELLPTKHWPGLAPVYDAFDDWLANVDAVLYNGIKVGVPVLALVEGTARLKEYIHRKLDTL